jgi:hypothetical protein
VFPWYAASSWLSRDELVLEASVELLSLLESEEAASA